MSLSLKAKCPSSCLYEAILPSAAKRETLLGVTWSISDASFVVMRWGISTVFMLWSFMVSISPFGRGQVLLKIRYTYMTDAASRCPIERRDKKMRYCVASETHSAFGCPSCKSRSTKSRFARSARLRVFPGEEVSLPRGIRYTGAVNPSSCWSLHATFSETRAGAPGSIQSLAWMILRPHVFEAKSRPRIRMHRHTGTCLRQRLRAASTNRCRAAAP